VIEQGCRYRIKTTGEEGMVMYAGPRKSQWCELRDGWPFPGPPRWVDNADLERVPMRDKRGEPTGFSR